MIPLPFTPSTLRQATTRLRSHTLWALLAVCGVMLCAGCKSKDNPPPLPSQLQISADQPGIPSGRPAMTTLKIGPELAFKVGDFPLQGERLVVLLEPHIWAHKRSGKEEDNQALLDLLQARAPWPYELKRRKMLADGEKPWATISVNYQLRLDRLKWKQGAPSLGSLRFTFDITVRDIPDGFVMNWDGIQQQVHYTRPYEKFQNIDDEVRGLIHGQLPGLVTVNEEQSKAFIQKMELRRELLEGRLTAALREPLVRIHEGGCLSTSRPDGEAIYRIQEPMKASRVVEAGPFRRLLCTLPGAFMLESQTRRVVSLQFQPWSTHGGQDESWQRSVSFDRDIDLDSLQILADEQTLCVTGERGGDRERYARVQCHDKITGEALWGWSAPGSDIAAATIYKQTFAIATGRHFTIFDLRTGQMLWQAEIEGATGITGRSQGCVIDNLLIFSPALGQHVAFDLEKRTSPWRFGTSGSGFLYCDGQGGMYVDEAGGLLLAIDPKTQKPRWRFRLPGEALDILYHGGHLMVLTQGALYALDTNTGALVWQQPLNVAAKRLLRHDRRLYIADETSIYSLTKANRI